MRFFNVLPIIATIVFSGLALASPISSVKATAAIHDRAPSVQARSNQIASIPVILTTVSGKIAPIVYELSTFHPDLYSLSFLYLISFFFC